VTSAAFTAEKATNKAATRATTEMDLILLKLVVLLNRDERVQKTNRECRRNKVFESNDRVRFGQFHSV
jgi:hypothetical protein